MADVATRLRSARERAGLTIEDVAARTKINPMALGAIERGEFERLPGEFFARAFVRSYAQDLRLPLAEVMAEYEAVRPKPSSARDDRPVRRAAPHVSVSFRTPQLDRATTAWSLGALALVVMAIIFAVNRPEARDGMGPHPVGTSGATPIAQVAPEPAPAVTQPAPVAPPNLTLEIRPSRRLWVTARADGKRVLFRNIQPDERVVIEATDELSFRVGDAGAFEYTLNGAAGKPPGRSGEVREFRITRENYRAFAR
jgi:cytoskeletal protein RodZ